MLDNEKPAGRTHDGLSDVLSLAAEHEDSSTPSSEQRRSGYPYEPGWRSGAVGETSRNAAVAAKPQAAKQADLCLGVIKERGHATPEQITSTLLDRGHRVLLTSIRARCTGLHKQGVLRDSGNRGLGESQRCKVISWEVVPGVSA